MLGDWWGDYASVAGLVIGLAGFTFTIWFVRQSKTAAKAAKDAAEGARKDMRRVLVLTDLATAIAVTEEIMRLQRQNAWLVAVDRYTRLRQLLVNLHSQNQALPGKQKRLIQGVISQIAVMQETLEADLHAKSQPNTPRLHAVMADQLDALQQLSANLNVNKD